MCKERTIMGYNIDEKMSGLASVIYTEFNDILSVDYNDCIIIEVNTNEHNPQRVFDKVLEKLIEIEQEQYIAIVYQYTEDVNHEDGKLKIKVVESYKEFTDDDWYFVGKLN